MGAMRTKERAMEWAEIAQRVRQQRIKLEMTQQGAAAAAGVGSGTWLAIERASRETFDEKTLRKVCKALGWPANQIAVWRGEESKLEPAPEDETPSPAPPSLSEEMADLRAQLQEMESDLKQVLRLLNRQTPNGGQTPG